MGFDENPRSTEMEGSYRLHDLTYNDNLYAGTKGLNLATPAPLTLRLLQYESLACDANVPPSLRDYSVAAVAEIREELARRAPRTEAA